MMGFELILIPIIFCTVVAVLAVVFAVAVALGWRPPFNPYRPAQTSQTTTQILKERYARGDINREEYDRMRLELES